MKGQRSPFTQKLLLFCRHSVGQMLLVHNIFANGFLVLCRIIGKEVEEGNAGTAFPMVLEVKREDE